MGTNNIQDEQMVHLVRNALLVAGHEMGAPEQGGDHWPIINATIHSVMQDWEDLKIERNVHEELSQHYKKVIDDLEAGFASCPDDLKPTAQQMIGELRELHHSCFDPINHLAFNTDDVEQPTHIERMLNIIDTLGDTNA